MKKIVITDLDDTIWKWFDMWYESSNNFYNNISKFCNVELETLYADFRKIHQRYYTTESSSQIDELNTLTKENIEFINNVEAIDGKSIMHKYHSDRLHGLFLYPNILPVLQILKENDIKIVGFTESNTFHTLKRVKQLDLECFFHSIYAAKDLGKKEPHERYYDNEHYELASTKLIELPAGTKKPDKGVLIRILRDNSLLEEDAIYIGDKLQKDVVMANSANIFSVYAKYGDMANNPRYELLKKVSHWSDEDIKYEEGIKKLATKSKIKPNATVINFKQILNFIH